MLTPNARKAAASVKGYLASMPRKKLEKAVLALWAQLRLDLCTDPGSIGLPDAGKYGKAAGRDSLECLPEPGPALSASDYVDFVNDMMDGLGLPEPKEYDRCCG